MKTILATIALALTATFALPPAAHAQTDQVTFQVRYGKERDLRNIVFALHPDAAPETVANFQRLVRKGFYNGVAVHRAFPDYLIQTGDPLSRKSGRRGIGTGGPGYTLAPEIRLPAKAGAVAMGRLPDKINPTRLSNGSQFFILLKRDAKLDGTYTVFGTVTEGLDLVREISKKSTDTNDMPVERVVIHKARLGTPAPKAPTKTKRFWLF